MTIGGNMTSHRFKKLVREAKESFHSEEGAVRLVQLNANGTIAKVWEPSEADEIPAGTTVHVQACPMIWAVLAGDEVDDKRREEYGKHSTFIANVPNAKGQLEAWLVLSRQEAITIADTWGIR